MIWCAKRLKENPWFLQPKSYIAKEADCCRKTAVCNGDQLLDFSVPELVRRQSTFGTDSKVLQNCAGFTLCSSAGLAVSDCAAVLGLTPCMLCAQIYCVLCVFEYYMLNSQL